MTQEEHNQIPPAYWTPILDLCLITLKKPGQLCTTSLAPGCWGLAGMGAVLAGWLSGWDTHKPRGQYMKRVDTALGYDTPPHPVFYFSYPGLPSIPLRMCFFHPQTCVRADPSHKYPFVLPGPLILILQVLAFFWEGCPGCPHPQLGLQSLFWPTA